MQVSCAWNDNERSCEGGVGVGAAGGRCLWRDVDKKRGGVVGGRDDGKEGEGEKSRKKMEKNEKKGEDERESDVKKNKNKHGEKKEKKENYIKKTKEKENRKKNKNNEKRDEEENEEKEGENKNEKLHRGTVGREFVWKQQTTGNSSVASHERRPEKVLTRGARGGGVFQGGLDAKKKEEPRRKEEAEGSYGEQMKKVQVTEFN